MAILAPDCSSAVTLTTSATSQQFSLTMAPNSGIYILICGAACWIAQGSNPTATVGGAGSVQVPAGVGIPINPLAGPKLAIIQDSAASKATLCRSAAF